MFILVECFDTHAAAMLVTAAPPGCTRSVKVRRGVVRLADVVRYQTFLRRREGVAATTDCVADDAAAAVHVMVDGLLRAVVEVLHECCTSCRRAWVLSVPTPHLSTMPLWFRLTRCCLSWPHS